MFIETLGAEALVIGTLAAGFTAVAARFLQVYLLR